MTLSPLKQGVSRSHKGASYSIGITSFPPYEGRVSPSTGRELASPILLPFLGDSWEAFCF